MFGFKVLKQKRGAFVENIKSRWFQSWIVTRSIVSSSAFCLGVLCLLLSGVPGTAKADFITVQTSTGAVPTLGAQFLSEVQNRFTATTLTNPFFPGTYQVMLYGTNPSFNPPLSDSDTIQMLQGQIDSDAQYLANVDSYTYVYGFAAGIDQQRQTDGMEASFGFTDCVSSPTLMMAPSADSQNCNLMVNIASATVGNLRSVCASTTTQVATFGSVVDTGSCNAILPSIQKYLVKLSSGCAAADTIYNWQNNDVANCQQVSGEISNSIYNTQFDSSTWTLPVLP
jgi:hypothetical protein